MPRFSREWWGDLLVGAPLRILLVLVVAVVLRWLVHRAVDRLVDRVRTAPAPGAAVYSARRALRAATMGSLFKSIATAAIAAVVVVTALGQVGVDIGPIIASAGIVGVAFGFGAQNLVKDFLSGVFMLLEDQYGVGDVIDTGDATGTVEEVGLRVTRLRDVNGTVWYVRNGEVARIGNQSQGWSRSVVDIAVGVREDVTQVEALLREAAADLQADPDVGPVVLEVPEVWGVEGLTVDAVLVRVAVRTAPGEQWRVARALRVRLQRALHDAGVDVPAPTRPAYPPLEQGAPGS